MSRALKTMTTACALWARPCQWARSAQAYLARQSLMPSMTQIAYLCRKYSTAPIVLTSGSSGLGPRRFIDYPIAITAANTNGEPNREQLTVPKGWASICRIG